MITRYAQRMLIENALSDAVRFFHMNALSSAVGIKVDFDRALLVITSGLYRLLARKMRRYGDAHADRILRDLVDMPSPSPSMPRTLPCASIVGPTCRSSSTRGCSTAKPVEVPWWNEASLRLTT